jgi:hypothetical protein
MHAKDASNKGKQQATTSQHKERRRGWHNTNASAMTAMGTMAMATVTAATMMTMTTTLAAAASIEGLW